MGGNGDVIMAGITLLPPTTMRVFSVHDVNGATVQTFPLFPARLGSEMECQALGAVKGQMALLADDGGLLELIVVRTWGWLVSITGPASSAFAGVVGRIVVVITAITFRAPIALVDETFYGGASFIMGVTFENDNLVFCVRATEYQKKRMLSAQHFQLVGRIQRREVCLELFQFRQAARTFRDACISVELPSHDTLPGKTSFPRDWVSQSLRAM